MQGEKTESTNKFSLRPHSAGHLLEGQGGLIPVLSREVVVHAEVCLAAQLVPRGAVRDALNHPALRGNPSARPVGQLLLAKA